MKKILFLLLCSFYTLSVNGQEETTEQIAAEQTIVQFFDALSALDFDKMRYYTKDIEFVEHGEVWNLDILIDRIKPMVGKGLKRANTFTFNKTVLRTDTAWVIYHNTADFEMNGEKDQAKWLESVVLIKDEGRWKLSLLHSTELEDKK